MFQCLWAFLSRHERGKTARASAASFKFARLTPQDRKRGKVRLCERCAAGQEDRMTRQVFMNCPRLEGDLPNIVAIGKKPPHRFFESFEKGMFRLETEELFGATDI